MDVVVSPRGSTDPPRLCATFEWGKESNRERATAAVAREMEVYESTASLDFHSSREFYGKWD